MTFEKALETLENITNKLEDGKESLDESMRLYEQGMILKEFCDAKLKEAENKWILLKKDKSGEITGEVISSNKIPEPNELQGQIF